MFETFYNDYLTSLFGQLVNPAKRIYLLYLASALILALAVLIWRCNYSLRMAIAGIFNRKVWCGESASRDYAIIAINHGIMMLLSPLLLARLTIATFIYFAFIEWFGEINPGSDWPTGLVSAAFTLSYFLLDDWSRYALHKWMHKWPVLWCFHKIHHTARTLSPLTVYRVHPVEGILFSLRSALVQGVTTSSFIFFFGQQVSLATVLGASLFSFVFNIVGSNLRHSHIRLSYPKAIERIFISPFQHQLHHSSAPQHFDKNFGAMLAVWDWFGQSLIYSEGQAKPRFGVSRRRQRDEQSLTVIYLHPFLQAWRLLWRKRLLKESLQ